MGESDVPARAVVMIPARLESARFPEKVLASRTGRTLIQHVHDRARLACSASRVVVATESERVAEVVRGFGGEVVLTRRDHPNGTSRLAEGATKLGLSPEQIVVNVQGDEPEIEPEAIDAGVRALVESGAPAATLATPMAIGDDPGDPSIVKVVRGVDGRALYFSRARIPFDRDGVGEDEARPMRHVGLYVYRRSFLAVYASMPETPLERAERLEQLRILEHGHVIAVAVVDSPAAGIDTPAQYEAFVARWRAGQ